MLAWRSVMLSTYKGNHGFFLFKNAIRQLVALC